NLKMKRTYFFDAVLVSTTLPRLPSPDTSRVYNIRLYNEFEDIPDDRFLVDQFPKGSYLAEYEAVPCDLIGSLAYKGVHVGLSENVEQIAVGKFKLSSIIMRQLADPYFLVTQRNTVELFKDTDSMCFVEVIVKIASPEPNIDPMLVNFGTYDVCRPAEPEDISKRDFIITMGRPSKLRTSTNITDKRLMLHAGAPVQCTPAPTEDAEAKGGAAAGCGCYRPGMVAPNAEEEAREKEKAVLEKLIEELGLDKPKVPKPPPTFELSRRYN
ncbi:hypothetical protein KR032_011127, partial [Drosophila birchii]